MFHATFSFWAEKVNLSKEETGVGISRLSCTAASVATGLFFFLQPKKLNGEKGVQARGEVGAHQGMAKRDILLLLVEKVICHKDGAEVVFHPGVFGENAGMRTDEESVPTLYTTCIGISTHK